MRSSWLTGEAAGLGRISEAVFMLSFLIFSAKVARLLLWSDHPSEGKSLTSTPPQAPRCGGTACRTSECAGRIKRRSWPEWDHTGTPTPGCRGRDPPGWAVTGPPGRSAKGPREMAAGRSEMDCHRRDRHRRTCR